jgi:dipeptidase D
MAPEPTPYTDVAVVAGWGPYWWLHPDYPFAHRFIHPAAVIAPRPPYHALVVALRDAAEEPRRSDPGAERHPAAGLLRRAPGGAHPLSAGAPGDDRPRRRDRGIVPAAGAAGSPDHRRSHMKTLARCLGAVVAAALACGGPTAERRPPDSPAAAPDGPPGRWCDRDCVVDTFKQLAPLYRPSGEEQAMRARIVELATQARDSRWATTRARPEILAPDRAGNFVIRVPATGAFAGSDLPPVALQAHMDMVLAASGLGPRDDLRAHFRAHPIALEERDGRLHSAGQSTSIGADNGVGCALMLRYALDPTLPHPPLELVFTVSEEVGLRGAREFDTAALPLRAPVMINLDGFDASRIIHGSQGSARRTVSGTLPTRPARAGKLLTVALDGLRGGHSGADIHRQRLNAVLLLATLTEAALRDRALAVVRATAGDLKGLNKIPTGLELTLAAPARFDTVAFRTRTQTLIAQTVAAQPGEVDNRAVAVTVEEAPAPAGLTVLPVAAARRLVQAVLGVGRASPPLNGIISRKDSYPNGVNTSSNLAVLALVDHPDDRARRTLTLGFLTRSFSAGELDSFALRMVSQLKTAFADGEPVSVDAPSSYDPWLTDGGSWLVKLGVDLQVGGAPAFRGATVQAIGVEPSYFGKKFPHLQIVGMGATITEAHTVREAVSIQSIHDITAALDAFLVQVARAAPFRAAAAATAQR